jgi:hypothetical protein
VKRRLGDSPSHDRPISGYPSQCNIELGYDILATEVSRFTLAPEGFRWSSAASLPLLGALTQYYYNGSANLTIDVRSSLFLTR